MGTIVISFIVGAMVATVGLVAFGIHLANKNDNDKDA